MKTKIRQTSFSPRGNILGLIDAVTASEFRRCNQISPTLLSLLTQQVGMASKSNNAADNVYETLVMVSLGGKVSDTCRQKSIS